MSGMIHPSAVIEDGAQIAEDVSIGPFCVIGAQVTIGAGTVVRSHVVIEGRTRIGRNCAIYSFAVLGSPPQDLKFSGEESELIIGDHNVIREYVTMNPGTKDGGMKTVVGDHNLFMVSAHVAHDCIVGSRIILANNATLAGHVQVGDGAILGGLSAVHQFIRIGENAIVGGMSGVENDVIPYGRVKGERAHLAGLNLIGLNRRGFLKDDIRYLQKAFQEMFSSEGTLEERLDRVSAEFSGNDTVMGIVQFAREKTKFPLCQPPRKSA